MFIRVEFFLCVGRCFRFSYGRMAVFVVVSRGGFVFICDEDIVAGFGFSFFKLRV